MTPLCGLYCLKFSLQENTSLWIPKLKLSRQILILDCTYYYWLIQRKRYRFCLLVPIFKNVVKKCFQKILWCHISRPELGKSRVLAMGQPQEGGSLGQLIRGQAEGHPHQAWRPKSAPKRGRRREALNQRKKGPRSWWQWSIHSLNIYLLSFQYIPKILLALQIHKWIYVFLPWRSFYSSKRESYQQL